MTSEKSLLTIKEAANLLGVTPLTLRNWDKKGKLTPTRHPINNYRVYRRSDVERLIQEVTTNFVPRTTLPTKSRGPKKLDVKHF